MKYLIMEDFSGQPVPFIFPRRVDHADMRDQLPYGQVISAGVVEHGPEGFVCHGGNADHLGERGGCKRIDPRDIPAELRIGPCRIGGRFFCVDAFGHRF